MDTQTLIDRMMKLPHEIANSQLALLTVAQHAQEISNKIVKCETLLKAQIASETDDSGKKKYSNEDARRAAFAELAENELELKDLAVDSQIAEKELQLKKIEFECLVNEQKNIRSVLSFLSGKGE